MSMFLLFSPLYMINLSIEDAKKINDILSMLHPVTTIGAMQLLNLRKKLHCISTDDYRQLSFIISKQIAQA